MTYIYFETYLYLLIEYINGKIVSLLYSAFFSVRKKEHPIYFGLLFFALIFNRKYATFSHSHQIVSERLHSAESVCIIFMAYLPNMTPFESLSKYKCLLLFISMEPSTASVVSIQNILFAARKKPYPKR